ncbi:hypothetical protein TOPH_07283 [Tolypocladium ophioglossoides CBS 100239]|uniref:MYND-type zinc finger protein samB n=1 Tax=Tolypocladium ophioglossoides (strain CBS 100239) TaxID=1163406 RepID=A0A0L0N1X0_TOLOC|nr:hypothetical protein TOPH_07283 [Tolypocladium ophioglossoides CBS 100239]
MALPSVHAMPEHWTELSVAKRQKRLCSEEVEALKTSCAKDCGKKHVAECSSCYGKVLDRMRLRYMESQDREWFTQRRAFLHELEGLFQDASDRKRSLKFIEARIESEKEAWYRWVLRKYPEFIAVSDFGISQDELRGMLDDPDRSRQELVSMMLEGVGKPADWPASVDAFADKVAATKADPAELKKLYIAEFFINQPTGNVVESAQRYLDEYTSSETMLLEDIIDKIASDFQESRISQPQRDNHQRRLDELRRAKTAFEQNKLQVKGQLSGHQAFTASEELYDLPPCHVCRKTVDSNGVLSCSLCQAVTQMGGSKKLTVYCTEDCFRKGHGDHIAAEHDCEAGDKCVQLRDEDVEMDDGTSQAVSCKECVGQKRMTLYCSGRCAGENIAEHRQGAHGVKTQAEDAQGLVAPAEQVVESTLQKENPGLKMSRSLLRNPLPGAEYHPTDELSTPSSHCFDARSPIPRVVGPCPCTSDRLTPPRDGRRPRTSRRRPAEGLDGMRGLPGRQDPVPAQWAAGRLSKVSRVEEGVRLSDWLARSPGEESREPQPPPADPSSTFSIDFAVPTKAEVDDNFETLRDSHEQFLDELLPAEGDRDMSQWTPPVDGLQTPPASSTHSHSIQNLQGKPSFNLSSAESLLESFRSMVNYLPCIVLPADASVPHLAATRPFVLLAILAATSGSRTLQGHSLYDDEFRKVLGLKFVASGERSLELLQGILVYCAWWVRLAVYAGAAEIDASRYPLHLRPKNKQTVQYIRMAADLVHDLELDQEFAPRTSPSEPEVADRQLDGIRAYIGYCYIASTFLVTWRSKRVATSFTSWTATCCDILERDAQVDGDVVLASLYRSTSILYDAAEAIHERSGQTEQHRQLVLAGLELQFQELQARVPSYVASFVPVNLQAMFIGFYLDGCSLLKLPRAVPLGNPSLPPTPSKLYDCTVKLKKFLDHFLALDEAAFLCFTLNDWGRLVLSVILALRLSFPAPECPNFDTSWARSHLRLDQFLSRMCQETDLTSASKKVDVLSASRVVMGVVKEKYERRLRALEASQAAPSGKSHGCPMLDGSLEQYYPLWDAAFGSTAMPQPLVGPSETTSQPVFHDLWATMTMGWANESGMLGEEERW